MNTPTPRTAEAVRLCKVISSAFGPMVGADDMEKLERELTESQSWVRASMESTAIASSTIAQLTRERDEARLLINEDTRSVIIENDWLRKMIDAFAACGDCGDEWLMADYRDLPHVRARKAK